MQHSKNGYNHNVVDEDVLKPNNTEKSFDISEGTNELVEYIQYWQNLLSVQKQSKKFLEYEVYLDGSLVYKSQNPDELIKILDTISKFTNKILIKNYKWQGQRRFDAITINLKRFNSQKIQPKEQPIPKLGFPLAGLEVLGLDGLGSSNLQEYLDKRDEHNRIKIQNEELLERLREVQESLSETENQLTLAQRDANKYFEEKEELEERVKELSKNNTIQMLSGIAQMAGELGILDKLGLKKIDGLAGIPENTLSDEDRSKIDWANSIIQKFSQNLPKFNQIVTVLANEPSLIDVVLDMLINKEE